MTFGNKPHRINAEIENLQLTQKIKECKCQKKIINIKITAIRQIILIKTMHYVSLKVS